MITINIKAILSKLLKILWIILIISFHTGRAVSLLMGMMFGAIIFTMRFPNDWVSVVAILLVAINYSDWFMFAFLPTLGVKFYAGELKRY